MKVYISSPNALTDEDITRAVREGVTFVSRVRVAPTNKPCKVRHGLKPDMTLAVWRLTC